MQLINGISDNAKQHFKIAVDNDNDVDLYLVWKSTQNTWFIDVIYGTAFMVYGLKMVMTPNLLSQFANKIPFGLAILCDSGQDPMTKTAFSQDGCTLVLLESSDVLKYEALYG